MEIFFSHSLYTVVQLLSCVQLFVTPWTAARQASVSFIIPQGLLIFMSIELVMLSISSSAVLFSFCLQSFPASGSFPMSWLFISGSQSIGASASVLPVNIQGLFPLGLTDLISLQSKGLSRVYISLHKYYLLLEWNRAWHQFHSYFLFYRWNAQKACSNSQVDQKKNGKNLFACIILL